MTYHGTLDKREPRGLVIISRNHIMTTKSINEWKTLRQVAAGGIQTQVFALRVQCSCQVPFSLSLPWVLMWHSEQVFKFVVWGNIWCGYAPADTQFLGTAIFFTLRGVSSSCKLSCYSQPFFFFFFTLVYAFRCSKACFSAPKWPRPIASLLEAWPKQTVGIPLLQYTFIQFSRVRWQRNTKTFQRSDRYGLL